MSINKEFIAKNIRERRRQKKWSQEYLAEKCDLSAQYISQIETKKKMASLKTVGKIAEALGVSIESITGNPMKAIIPKTMRLILCLMT